MSNKYNVTKAQSSVFLPVKYTHVQLLLLNDIKHQQQNKDFKLFQLNIF